MAQHDYVIANGTGAAVRSDLNNALAAIVSQNSGATAPSTTYAYMPWADTTTGLYKIRNAANNGWITLYQLDGEWSTLAVENGSAAAPSIYFKDSGTDTGIYSPGTDQVAISTGGTGRLFVDSSGRVGLGISSPGAILDVSGSGNLVRLGDGTNTFDVRFKGPNNWAVQLDTSADKFNIQRNSSSLVTVASSGAVGIGTTSPNQALEVVGSQWLRGAYTDTTALAWVGTTGGPGRDFAIKRSAASTMSVEMSGRNVLNFVGNTGDTNCNITFSTTGASEAARIDSSGRLLVGTSTARTTFFNGITLGPAIQIEGTGGGRMASIFSDNNDGGALILGRQGGSTLGGNTLVANGDEIGIITFQASDGTDPTECARIQAVIDGTPGNNDMPGRLVFSTTKDGASSPTTRFSISNQGIAAFVCDSNDVINASTTVGAGTANVIFKGFHSGTAGTIYSGTNSISIYTNGNIQNTNNSYGALSDIKLKENIIDAGSQWNDLKALQVRKYNLKEGQTHTQIGLIAQEAELVSPGLVYETPDRDEDGNETGEVTKGVNYSVLYMKAIKALQEAMERIETLEAKVAALEAS